MTRAEPFACEPVRKKVVRIERCQSQSLMCSDGATGLKCNTFITMNFVFILMPIDILFFYNIFLAIFIYLEDPRGNIPKPIWSWAAKVHFQIDFYFHDSLRSSSRF